MNPKNLVVLIYLVSSKSLFLHSVLDPFSTYHNNTQTTYFHATFLFLFCYFVFVWFPLLFSISQSIPRLLLRILASLHTDTYTKLQCLVRKPFPCPHLFFVSTDYTVEQIYIYIYIHTKGKKGRER